MYRRLLGSKEPVPKLSLPIFPQEVVELFASELLQQWNSEGPNSDPAESTYDSKIAHKALTTLLLVSRVFYQTARRVLFRKTTIYIYVDETKAWNVDPRKLLVLLKSNPSLVADIRHFQIVGKRFHPKSHRRVAGRGLTEGSLPYLLEYIGNHGSIERLDLIGYHHHGQLFYEADQLFSWHKLSARAQAGLQAIRGQSTLRTLVLCRFHRPSAAFLAGLEGKEDSLESLYLFESRFWVQVAPANSSWRLRRSDHGDQVSTSPLRQLRALDASQDSLVCFANVLGPQDAEGNSRLPSLPYLTSLVVHHGLWGDCLSDTVEPLMHQGPEGIQRSRIAVSCLQQLATPTLRHPLEHISIQFSLLRQFALAQKPCLPRGLTSVHIATCILLPYTFPEVLADLHTMLSTVIRPGLPLLKSLHLTLYIRSGYHYPANYQGWKTHQAADYISLPPIETIIDEETGDARIRDNSEVLQMGGVAWGHMDDLFSSWLPGAGTSVPGGSAGSSQDFLEKFRLEFLLGFCTCFESPFPSDEMEEARRAVEASLPKTFGLLEQTPGPEQSQTNALEFRTVPTHSCRYNDHKRDRLYFSRTIGL